MGHQWNHLWQVVRICIILPFCFAASLKYAASPISDILERDSFTLEDLLEEGELLQELKARNSKLIEL